MTTETQAITRKYGPQQPHDGTAYTEADWSERDNFASEYEAAEYARYLSRKHFRTPYRVYERDARFVVEFVPEWNLR